MPTIYDKDLIIYAFSQIIAKHEEGKPLPKTVEIDPYAFLVYTQRGTGGRDYDALCDNLDRLHGTRFRTNVVFEGTRKDEWMGIIDRAALITDEATGKARSLRITLSETARRDQPTARNGTAQRAVGGGDVRAASANGGAPARHSARSAAETARRHQPMARNAPRSAPLDAAKPSLHLRRSR